MLSQASKIERTLLALAAIGLLLAGCSTAPPGAPHVENSGSRNSAISEETAVTAAEIALDQVGIPYRYGGASRSGFDCSGLVHYAYASAGRRVPRTTGELWRSTQPLAERELQAGDVLFFRIEGKMSHVGLYLGDGQFVHAPSTGKRVSLATLDAEFYREAFIRGGRL